jgi:hypothetical protein
MQVVNCIWGNDGAAMTISGLSCVIIGNRFSGAVTLASGSAGQFIGNYFTTGTLTDSTTASGLAWVILHKEGGASAINMSGKLVLGNTGSDSTSKFLVVGTATGVRIGTTATVCTLDGVDNTGVGSYQPLVINGSTVNIGVSGVPKILLDASGNLGLVATSFGTNAVGVFAVKNGTAPTTGPADTVQFYSSDISAGNTEPSFFCEGTAVLATGQADSASSVRVKMRINGTEVTLLAI